MSHVDSYIVSRLSLLKFNYKTTGYAPIKVYTYQPDREKGETVYPSLVAIRQHVEVRQFDQRYDYDIFIPSETTITVAVPGLMGGGVATGPVSYTRKPHPIPVDIYYQIDTLSTSVDMHNWLTESVYQLFPPGMQASVPNLEHKQYASFYIERVICEDDLVKPVFRSTYVLGVFDLWLDRVEHYTSPSITSISADFVQIDQ